jgi:hypothetical protein
MWIGPNEMFLKRQLDDLAKDDIRALMTFFAVVDPCVQVSHRSYVLDLLTVQIKTNNHFRKHSVFYISHS